MQEPQNENGDRAYFAQRAAEEQEAALAARDTQAERAHRSMQRAYLERACVGERAIERPEQIG